MSNILGYFDSILKVIYSCAQYLSERVKELTGGRQSPTMIRPTAIPDFPVAVKPKSE
ncbi:MAG: hypothetical protein ACU843_17010 [Gammaproteobacteria bacterium]